MIRAAVVAALLAPASAAVASGHHGGGGGGGGATHPGTAPSSTTMTTTGYVTSDRYDYRVDPPPPACVETTDVVGLRECERFGSWSQNLAQPSLFLDLGVHVRQLPALGAATLSAMRVGLGFGPHLYVAVEGEFGGLSTDPAEMASRGTVVGGYGVVGARARAGQASLAVELAGGGRMATTEAMPAVAGGVLETRVRGELWLGPSVSIGATLGASVIERGDWIAGAYVGFHSRAFGGGR